MSLHPHSFQKRWGKVCVLQLHGGGATAAREGGQHRAVPQRGAWPSKSHFAYCDLTLKMFQKKVSLIVPFLPELRRVVVGLKADFKMEAEARLALAKQRYLRDNGLPCSTEVQIVGVHLRLGDYAHHLVCPIVFFKKRKCIKSNYFLRKSCTTLPTLRGSISPRP